MRQILDITFLLFLLLVLIMTVGEADANQVDNYKGREFELEVVKGNVPRHELVHKFGRNSAVGTSLVPITSSGVYRTPTSAVALELVSDSVNDAAAGSGARTVEVIGLGSDWAEQSETVTMNGTSAVALSNSFTRVYRMRVLTSGTYATQSAGSHSSTITLRESGAGQTWATISNIDGFGLGQSLIGAISIPAGKRALITGKNIFVDSSKTTTVLFFYREGIDQVSAPYSPMKVLQSLDSQAAGVSTLDDALPMITGPADLGVLAKVSTGTSSVDVEFDVLIVTPAGDGKL